jgi:hypothetical protein
MTSKKQKSNDHYIIIDTQTSNTKQIANKPLANQNKKNNKIPINEHSEELMDEAKIKMSKLAEEAKKIWNK